MKKVYLILSTLICTIGVAQVPDTVRHLAHDFPVTLDDFAWNSAGSFMVAEDKSLYRWTWNNDTSLITLPNHFRYTKIDRLIAGEFLVFGRSSNFYGIATKIDSSGNIIWQTEFNKDNKQINLGAFYENNDKSLIVAGGKNEVMLAALNANGDTTKVVIYPVSSFNGITDIIKTSDGNYLGGGYLDDYAYAVKFTPNLDTLWTFTSSNFISLNQIRMFEESNGNFSLLASNHLITISSSGKFISDSIISKSYMNDFIIYNSEILGVGRNKGSAMPALYLYNTIGDSVDSRIYHYSGFKEGAFVKVKKLRDGTYAGLGYAKDSAHLSTNVNLNFISILGAPAPASIIDNEITYTIYPNPVQSYIKIEGYSGAIQIVNSKGEIILKKPKNEEGIYNLDKLARGSYILFSEKGEYLNMFIKN